MAKSSTNVFVLMIVSILAVLFSLGILFSYGGSQDGFILNINAPSISYTLSKLNNSMASLEFDFPSGGGNQTIYFFLPKNSSVSSISMDFTGKLVAIYGTSVVSVPSGQHTGLTGVSVGNVTADNYLEIAAGDKVGDGNVWVLRGSDGSVVWSSAICSPWNVLSTSIGNVSAQSGEEVAAGCSDGRLYLLNSTGTQIWDYLTQTDSPVKSVKISDIDSDGVSEVIASSDTIVYVLNSTGQQKWNISVSYSINELAVGELASDSGKEILAGGSAGNLKIINSTGSIIASMSAGASQINTVDIGNVSDQEGNEIVAGTGVKIYLLNSTGGEISNYSTGGSVNSVRIGELTTDFSGNEIFAGCNDQKIYILNRTGNLIGEFMAGNYINAVDWGNAVSNRTGNEGIGGGADGKIYVFNFDDFPTNLTLDVGNDSTKEWRNYTYTKLRTTEAVSNLSILSAMTNYLASCTPTDASGNCIVPMVMNSVWQGRLNISSIAVVYSYNTTSLFSKAISSNWSRITNISAGEQVGNNTYNISFSGKPSENVTISYLRVNDTSASCDFNRTARSVTTITGQKVCDISATPISFTVNQTINSALNTYLFWYDTLGTGVPVQITNTSGYYSTSGSPEEYNRVVNLSTNITGGVFTNVTLNWTVNDSEIVGEEFLRVIGGSVCDITPGEESQSCNSSSPNYTLSKSCPTYNYQVCMMHIGNATFFKWVQSSATSLNQTHYQAGGSYNQRPIISNMAVSQNDSLWGNNLTFSVNVSDAEGDLVNISLWVHNSTSWIMIETRNVSSGIVQFNATTNKSWVGNCSFLFEYLDYNNSWAVSGIHNASNTSSGIFFVGKHSAQVIYYGLSAGNASSIFRNDSEMLSIFVNDTSMNSSNPVIEASCALWLNDTMISTNTTNSTGYCNIALRPNQSTIFNPSPKAWKIGILNATYYNDTNSTNLSLTVRGWIRPNLTSPDGSSFYRGVPAAFGSQLLDEFNQTVNSSSYNCNFSINSNMSSSLANATSNGSCLVYYTAQCAVDGSVGPKALAVNATRTGGEDYYNISSSNDSRQAILMDQLAVSISKPNDINYFTGQSLNLTASVSDSCASLPAVSANWSLVRKNAINITITDLSLKARQDYPIIISGETFSEEDFNFTDWPLNHTRLLLGGADVPYSIIKWADANHFAKNNSQDYMGGYSELLFFVNLSSGESKTYILNLTNANQDYPQGYQNISYNILNAGFDGGNLSYWSASQTTNAGSFEGVSSNGPDIYANLSADGETATITQNLPNLTFPTTMYVKYRAMGTYNSTSGRSSFHILAGGAICNLTSQILANTDANGTVIESPNWTIANCTNASFASARNISIVVSDKGNGGGYPSNTIALIDYVCFGNSSGSCIDFDSGSPIRITPYIKRTIGIAGSYTLAGVDEVGRRKIAARADAPYYDSGRAFTFFNLTGFAQASSLEINSSFCAIDPENSSLYLCMANSTFSLVAGIYNNYTQEPIMGYNVSFFNNSTGMGTNLTSILGLAIYGARLGAALNHSFSANISTQSGLHYNASLQNQRSVFVNVDTSQTTGNLTLNYTNVSASDISVDNTFTLPVLWILNNTGTKGMYSLNISHNIIAGVSIPGITCAPLAGGTDCTKEFNITVDTDAALGNHPVIFNATWLNGDGNYTTATSNFTLFVNSSPRVKFDLDNLTMQIPVSTNRSSNVTVLNYGNTNLTNVSLNITGTNSSRVEGWFVFSPSALSILKGNMSNMTVSFAVPQNATTGLYYLNITANITNCTSNCSANLALVLNITPLDWTSRPETNLTKLVGLKEEVNKFGEINITNTIRSNLSFNISVWPVNGTALEFLTLNQTRNITSQIVTVPANSTRKFEIFYNTSVSPNTTGNYTYNLSIASTNSSIEPQSREIPLYFNIINFTVDIISPTALSPLGSITPVYANDSLAVEVISRMGGESIADNINWTILIGGQECSQDISPAYNNSSQSWSLRCLAPQVPFNPVNNDIEVLGNYSLLEVELSDTEENAVIYRDVVAPWFSNISASFFNLSQNLSEISFAFNVTDNKNISSVWAVVTGPGINLTLDSTNSTSTKESYGGFDDFDSYTYNFTFHNPNVQGDYDITVYANDTEGQQNSTLGWFDIYVPIIASGNLTDGNGDPIDANITFYRNGESQGLLYKMDNQTVDTGDYTWTLHKRKYDIRIDAFASNITLKDIDFNLTSNSTANPFKIDYFPNHTSSGITRIELPDTANRGKILTAIVVESPLNLTGADFIINYSDAVMGGGFTENLLEVFVCTGWDYDTRMCNNGTFSYLAGTSNLSGSNPNVSTRIFNFSSSHLSAYAIAESSYPDKWGVSPVTPSQQQNTGSSGSGSSSEEKAKSEANQMFCGNGICELGENSENCPDDCMRQFPLVTDTNLLDVNAFPGDNKGYWLTLENQYVRNISVSVSFSENLENMLSADRTLLTVHGRATEMLNISLNLSGNYTVGTYGGYMILNAGGIKANLPVTIRVLDSGASIFTIEVKLMAQQIPPRDRLDFVVKLANLGDNKVYPINLTYLIKNPKDREVLREYRSNISLDMTSLINESLDINISDEGVYTIEVWANYNGKNIMDVATFEIAKPLFQSPLTVGLIVLALIMIVAVGGTQLLKYYDSWKKENEKKQRYFYPLDTNTVPKEGFKIGKFAARDTFFYYDPRDLSTHVIVAGATGAGKSVSASVFAEEALDKNIPVIVFDPTAQWTGFVKPCKDKNLLARYPKFGMDEFDIKSYPGLIYDVESPTFKLDIKKFINPGEITVFCMNKLKPGEYDIAVNNIIAAIFHQTWEESTDLKVVIVFDEVHRLLEKYGGSGGYVALEKAAREFRKWGIGVIMCSQVLADFKEAIAGNVLTEVQLNTKSLEDIDKVKTKYGEKYSDRITRMGVGAGLLQYPKYNNGKPFFVEFRPTKHDPHKITDEELNLYKNYTKRLDIIGSKIESMKRSGAYTENYEVDYKLALGKLKRGNFRMAEIYISSLERSLENVSA